MSNTLWILIYIINYTLGYHQWLINMQRKNELDIRIVWQVLRDNA